MGITDVSKIRSKQEQQSKLKQLENVYNNSSYLYNQYEHYTKGNDSTQNKLNVLKDRTYLNPNDDFFGGKIKVTTRADRQMKLERHRSQSSASSKKSRKRGSSRAHRRQSSKYDKSKRKRSERHKQRHSPRYEEKESELKEPGNDHDDHPLNYDQEQKKRNSQKLSDSPPPNSNGQKRSFMHLTKKSLQALDKNSSL